jgi:hypothetical protein
MTTGSWRGTNALLLGVFQVTLFCPGLRRTGPYFSSAIVKRMIGKITYHPPHPVQYILNSIFQVESTTPRRPNAYSLTGGIVDNPMS